MSDFTKLLKHARAVLEPDEVVECAIVGGYETKIMGQDSARRGILLATNQRLVFYAKKLSGYEMENFPYQNISSIEMSKDFFGHRVKFFATGNKVELKWIKKNGGDVPAFVRLMKARIEKPNTTAPDREPAPSQPDLTTQLRRLALLNQEGVLTDAEFVAKKEQILARI